MSEAGTDHEAVYLLLYRERWTELLRLVYRSRYALEDDPLLGHAVDVFVSTFFAHLAAAEPDDVRTELETLFLLHTGDFYRLESGRFESVVEHLVRLNEGRPEAAVGYARHFPDNPVCTSVLDRFDLRKEIVHGQADRIRVEEIRIRDADPSEAVDHTTGLFRSRQEETFFLAVREVFAAYFAYPNVALSSVLDFESLRPKLSADERRFFFRGLVDCVVFDQQNGYRPRFFFELDSPHHDAGPRRENDRLKDGILAAAGRMLLRIRVLDRRAGRDEFVALLRDVARR